MVCSCVQDDCANNPGCTNSQGSNYLGYTVISLDFLCKKTRWHPMLHPSLNSYPRWIRRKNFAYFWFELSGADCNLLATFLSTNHSESHTNNLNLSGCFTYIGELSGTGCKIDMNEVSDQRFPVWRGAPVLGYNLLGNIWKSETFGAGSDICQTT